jgi:GT2 family glycosyltransferase
VVKPILSIIIVSYNTADITVNCLESIYTDKGLKDIPFEVIVIDNNSPDDSVSKIKKLKHPITVIVNKNNPGFGMANNQGLDIALGNYVLLLNPDTIVLHSAISQSLNWLCSHPESIGCTCQLLNADKSIQASGGYFPNIFNITAWCLGLDDLPLVNHFIKPFHPHTPHFYTHDKFYLTDHPQEWITGAFMMIRTNSLKAVGGFSKDFFMYGEEMEMCYRLIKKFPQNKFWYLIGPQIIHLGGKSSANKQLIYDREYDGMLLFFKLHRPKYQYPIIKLLTKINRLLQFTVYRIIKHV